MGKELDIYVGRRGEKKREKLKMNDGIGGRLKGRESRGEEGRRKEGKKGTFNSN